MFTSRLTMLHLLCESKNHYNILASFLRLTVTFKVQTEKETK